MNFNNFTIKAQETVQQAVQLVTQNNQQAIEPVHLLKAVIMNSSIALRNSSSVKPASFKI